MALGDYVHYRIWLALGLAACLIVFYGCLMHHPPMQLKIHDFDKIEHFGGYVVLGAWFGALLQPRYGWVLLCLSLFGGLIEIAQWFTSYRDAQLLDWVADTLGALVGLGLARVGAMGWLRYIDRRVTTAGNRHR